MRPHEARIWRKQWRDALKGTARGRRSTHKVETQEPQRGSTWCRRHPGEWPPYMRRWIGGES
jgi:hypothetical protein